MQKHFVSPLVVAAFMAVSTATLATDGVDPAHSGKHEKWKSPGDGPGQGLGHFKDKDDHGNPGNNDHDNGNHGKPDKGKPSHGGNGGQGGAGGNGGQGGAGGNANQLQGQGQAQGQLQGQAQGQSQNATGIGTGIASSSAGAASISGATAGGGAATAATGDVGNGNGSSVSVNNVDQSQSRYVAFMDAPALPATFGTAGIQARKVSECGPRYKITPFERDADVPFLALPFISFNRSVPIQTEHGMNSGFNTDKPFELIEFPVPGSDARFRVVMGHVLYMTTGHDSRGGATTGGANYAGTNAVGVAGGSSANNAYGVIGYVAVPCVFTPEKPAPTPVVPPVVSKPDSKGKSVKTTLAPIPAN